MDAVVRAFSPSVSLSVRDFPCADAFSESTAPTSQPRLHLTQEQLCCFTTNVVNPIYPREARLAHTEGVVNLTLVISVGNSKIVELQPVSGDPLLLKSTMNAIRQWHFMIGGRAVDGPKEMRDSTHFYL